MDDGRRMASASKDPRRTIGLILVLFAGCVLLLLIIGGAVVGFRYLNKPKPPVRVAQLVSDYRPETPAPGWQYLWNKGSVTGRANFTPLVWNGQSYGPDDNPQFPRPSVGRYVRLSSHGGHPGSGRAQGNSNEVYAIAGFAVTNAGWFAITNSHIMRNDGNREGEIVLRVFVNERPIPPELICNSKAHQTFDRTLGFLNKGETIYVAVGPNGTDRYDHFDWDFAIDWYERKH